MVRITAKLRNGDHSARLPKKSKVKENDTQARINLETFMVIAIH
jgi:hypothetical protein